MYVQIQMLRHYYTNGTFQYLLIWFWTGICRAECETVFEIGVYYGCYLVSASKCFRVISEAYLKSCQTSKIECFMKIVNGWK